MMNSSFQEKLRLDLEQFLSEQKSKYPETDLLKIDLHCHDLNSDVPDELIGRILNVPETWLPTEKLIEELRNNGSGAFTITNHNNARSCFEQQDKGVDILTGAEFSCWVPDFEIGIHVLTYGFTPEQEAQLGKLRQNLYSFLQYARKHNIPTIWAHPLYHYSSKRMPPNDFFDKMSLVFERFEMLNGQRDTWQNMLVKEWIGKVDEEMIVNNSRKFAIDPLLYCVDPYRKVLTGGSDSHMGVFSGMTGSFLYVPELEKRLQMTSSSQLALEAIRQGDIIPYGAYQNTESLTITFLNYVCQIAINYEDPGLVRLLLHKGNTTDKMISFAASNMFGEVQRHKVTMSFIKLFSQCMMGKSSSFLQKLVLPSVYKPIFDEVAGMAKMHKQHDEGLVKGYYGSILSINNQLGSVLFQRVHKKLNKASVDSYFEGKSLDQIIDSLELPTYIRSYIDKDEDSKSKIKLSKIMDGLSFSFLTSLFILLAHFTSAKVMFNTRPFLQTFSKKLNKYRHPKRIMWLTDTFGDKNGVSIFLQEMHKQIQLRNLPIDIVTCSNELTSSDNLRVLKPVYEFSLPIYKDQTLRIPNFVELHNLFLEGEYDRIICSTEGITGMFGLYLKHAYTVEANFYLHTDWLMFANKVIGIDRHNLNRVKRILRTFYNAFDRVLVLNSDQKKWLTGKDMNIDAQRVCQTAHWANEIFAPKPSDRKKVFGIDPDSPVLLYVGRVSNEKGVLELPAIYEQVRAVYKKAKIVIVGKGPALKQLEEEIPDGIFVHWVEQVQLPDMYSSADILLLPSRFDTFCNVVLESLSCGLPVVAYNTKGPKDIIRDNACGYLVNTADEMSAKVKEYLGSDVQSAFKQAAIKRAKEYEAGNIINNLLQSVGLNNDDKG